MKFATWNINGIKARIDGLAAYLREQSPDVIGLQEIKTAQEAFPFEILEDLGYNVAVCGQKGFNGVAIAARVPLDDILKGLPGDDTDDQARYIEATAPCAFGPVRFVSLYLPNGNPIGSEKFNYKLRWMARLQARVRELLALEMPVVLAGDYNVIPQPIDAKRPDAWVGDALFQPESRAALRRIESLGLTDAVRACHPGSGIYTFWDYQAGAWNKDDGIRIDHILLSPQAADHLTAAGVDRFTRSWEKPSDHAPVWVELT